MQKISKEENKTSSIENGLLLEETKEILSRAKGKHHIRDAKDNMEFLISKMGRSQCLTINNKNDVDFYISLIVNFFNSYK